MDSASDELAADFDDPALPPFIHGGGALIGELSNGKMTRSLPLWTLDELGYTYDPPHVRPDGRLESGVHPPDFYAYSPHTSSWEDGLQEIELFDWPGLEDSGQDVSKSKDEAQDDGDIAAANSVSCIETAGPDTTREHIVESKVSPDPIGDTAAPRILSVSPPWIPDPAISIPPAAPVDHQNKCESDNDGDRDLLPITPDIPISPASCAFIPNDPGMIQREDRRTHDHEIALPQPVVYVSQKPSDNVAPAEPSPAHSETGQGEGTPHIGGNLNAPVVSSLEQSPNLGELWLPQLQAAADDTSSDSLSELLPPGDRNRNVDNLETASVSRINDALVQESSPWAGQLLEQYLDRGSDLSTSPCPLGSDEAGDPNTKRVCTEEPFHGGRRFGSQASGKPSSDGEILGEMVEVGLSSSQAPLKVAEAPYAAETKSEVDAELPDTADGSVKPPEPSSTSKVPPKASNPRKRPMTTKKGKDVSDLEQAAPAAKKAKKNIPVELGATRPRNATKAPLKKDSDSQSPSKDADSYAAGANEEAIELSEHDAEILPIPCENRLRLSHFAYGTYSRPERAAISDTSGEIIFGTEAEPRQHDHENEVDLDMEEHYSDVESPVSPSKQVPIIDTAPNTPKSRAKVSKFELESLSATKYRDRSSKSQHMAGEETLAIPGPHFALHKNSTAPVGRKAHAEVSNAPSAVGPNAENSFMLIEKDTLIDAAVDADTINVLTPSDRKSTTSAPKSKAEKEKKAQPATKKPTGAATKNKRATTVPVENKEHDLFPSPKIELKKPRPNVDVPLPSKTRASTGGKTRGKEVAMGAEVLSFIETEHEHIANDAGHDDQQPHDDDDDSKDAQEHLTPPTHEDSVDSSSVPLPTATKPKKKAEHHIKNLLTKSTAAKSRSDTPASSITSSSSTARTNKYGFSSPRGPKTRQARKATATPASKSKAAPKSAAKAKGKNKKSDADAEPEVTASPTTPEPSIRQTRRASAREEDIRKAQEAEQKEKMEEARGKFRLKLRNKSVDEGS